MEKKILPTSSVHHRLYYIYTLCACSSEFRWRRKTPLVLFLGQFRDLIVFHLGPKKIYAICVVYGKCNTKRLHFLPFHYIMPLCSLQGVPVTTWGCLPSHLTDLMWIKALFYCFIIIICFTYLLTDFSCTIHLLQMFFDRMT